MTAILENAPTFEYQIAPIGGLQVQTIAEGKKQSKLIDFGGRTLRPTDRFWNSLYSRFGFNRSFFRYFTHDEVFDRISQVNKNDQLRLCIENGKDSRGNPVSYLQAVSGPDKPYVEFSAMRDTLSTYPTDSASYHGGVIESVHEPRVQNRFSISGDMFETRFAIHTPIDGYGLPSVYLSVLRMICSNGAVGFDPVFRSSITLGKKEFDVMPALERVLDGFGHDEGYAAIQNRLEVSAKSWASVGNMRNLYTLLVNEYNSGGIGDKGGIKPDAKFVQKMFDKGGESGFHSNPVLQAFNRMTGDPTELYGLANLDAMSGRKQALLPVNCTVYDMINFASEVASHHAEPFTARKLHAWFGSTISKEYDLEGTKDKFGEFKDFHIRTKLASGMTGSAN